MRFHPREAMGQSHEPKPSEGCWEVLGIYMYDPKAHHACVGVLHEVCRFQVPMHNAVVVLHDGVRKGK